MMHEILSLACSTLYRCWSTGLGTPPVVYMQQMYSDMIALTKSDIHNRSGHGRLAVHSHFGGGHTVVISPRLTCKYGGRSNKSYKPNFYPSSHLNIKPTHSSHDESETMVSNKLGVNHELGSLLATVVS